MKINGKKRTMLQDSARIQRRKKKSNNFTGNMTVLFENQQEEPLFNFVYIAANETVYNTADIIDLRK